MSTSMFRSIIYGPPPGRRLNVIKNTEIKLPVQQLASPGHWKLKNLRHLVAVIARLEGFKDSNDYITNATTPNDEPHAQILYGLVAVLSGNCWDIQKSHNLPLRPVAPANLEFLALRMMGQNVPQVASAYIRNDGTGVVSFRGTTTMRENMTDASTIVGYEKTLPLFGNATRDSQPPTYMSSFCNAFMHKDNDGKSMEGFLVNFANKIKNTPNTTKHLIISGHSLGGAFAELAAYVGIQLGLTVSLTAFAPAQGSTVSFCNFMQRHGANMYTVINAQDYVPQLHSFIAKAVHCCPIVYLNAVSNSGGIFSRLETHDPLYYGYALLANGSLPSLPQGVVCSRISGQTKSSLSIPPSPTWKNYEQIDSIND